MPPTFARLPSLTWEEMEAILDELAATEEQRDQALTLLALTRSLSETMSPLDLMREIFCIALVLPCENDRSPRMRLTGRIPPYSEW
jgi:hypothetical protein